MEHDFFLETLVWERESGWVGGWVVGGGEEEGREKEREREGKVGLREG